MKAGRLQAKDLSDAQVLEAMAATRGRNGVPNWSTLWDVQGRLDAFPPKVVQAKLALLIRRNVIGGCACGCRGDFEVRA